MTVLHLSIYRSLREIISYPRNFVWKHLLPGSDRVISGDAAGREEGFAPSRNTPYIGRSPIFWLVLKSKYCNQSFSNIPLAFLKLQSMPRTDGASTEIHFQLDEAISAAGAVMLEKLSKLHVGSLVGGSTRWLPYRRQLILYWRDSFAWKVSDSHFWPVGVKYGGTGARLKYNWPE